jgi:hypothetical protein
MEEARRNHVFKCPWTVSIAPFSGALVSKEDVQRLILTASGGPFLDLPLAKLRR